MKNKTKIFITDIENFLNERNIKNFYERSFLTYKQGPCGGIIFSKSQKGKTIDFSLNFEAVHAGMLGTEAIRVLCKVSLNSLDTFSIFILNHLDYQYLLKGINTKEYLNDTIENLFKDNDLATLIIDVFTSEISREEIIQHNHSSSFKKWVNYNKNNIENLKNLEKI